MTGVEKHTLIALKEGQIKAFEIVYRFYNGWVYHFIYAIIKDTNIAQDLAQDVFLIIWNRKEDIDCNANFESYLFKIARNTVYHYVKRELLLQNYVEKESKGKASEDSEVEDDLDSKFLEEYIMKLINELPESRKRIFLLYWKRDRGEIIHIGENRFHSSPALITFPKNKNGESSSLLYLESTTARKQLIK